MDKEDEEEIVSCKKFLDKETICDEEGDDTQGEIGLRLKGSAPYNELRRRCPGVDLEQELIVCNGDVADFVRGGKLV